MATTKPRQSATNTSKKAAAPVQAVGALAASTVKRPPKPAKQTAALIKRWAHIPTPTLFDTMEKMGIASAAVLSLDIRPLVQGVTLAGPAYTIRCAREPRSFREYNPGGLGRISTMFNRITPGDIVVVDGAGDRTCGHWGEMMSMMARQFGAAGVVVDGGTRDSLGIRHIPDWACFARYTTPIEGLGKVRMNEVQVHLRLDGQMDFGVTVAPGDWIVADDDAVMRVPADRMVEILEACEQLEELEIMSRHDLLRGDDVDEVFARYGRG